MSIPTVALRSTLLAAAFALSACSIIGGSKEPPQLYAPRMTVAPDAAWPRVDAQLTIDPVQIDRPYDSARIAVRPTPQELQVYKGGVWAQRPSDMIAGSLLQAFEDSGRLRAVARAGSGVNGDYRLLLEVRRFEADYDGGAIPKATIEISAKLLQPDAADVVASRTFAVAEPASGTAMPEVVDAFDRAIVRLDREVIGWTLTSMREAH